MDRYSLLWFAPKPGGQGTARPTFQPLVQTGSGVQCESFSGNSPRAAEGCPNCQNSHGLHWPRRARSARPTGNTPPRMRPTDRSRKDSLHYATTIFTNLFGITMIFLIVLPSMKGLTFSDDLAISSSWAWVASTEALITSRSFPLTWTGISIVSSTSLAASNCGQGA